MIDLQLELTLRVRIDETLNERLENGEEKAFEELEAKITEHAHLGGLFLSEVHIEDAGEHNVSPRPR